MDRQRSLFDGDASQPNVIRFSGLYASWRREAWRAVHQQMAPDTLTWVADSASTARTPPEFELDRAWPQFDTDAAAVACHSAADRWSLLYRLLWRYHAGEAHVLDLSGDPAVVRFRRYAKAVRRDVHKMKAFVRFRDEQDIVNGGRRWVAWFEPDHHIVAVGARFFRKRFANARWSILTPDRCAHYEGSGGVWFAPGVSRPPRSAGAEYEEAWRVYYQHIFNPARLKEKAMMAEMPKKYWRNLPEAALIGELANGARQGTHAMLQRPPNTGALNCGPRPSSPARQLEDSRRAAPTALARLALAASACRRCDLAASATQTVFGEGDPSAALMLVGEQPGDREDITGRPFVGPAGALLDRALAAVELDRSQLYLTNAVKHFHHRPRGKRRMHAKPRYEHIVHCRPWLADEIAAVDPAVILCLGVTAAQAVLERPIVLGRDRGKAVTLGERSCWITAHPASVLRGSPGDPAHSAAFDRLVSDLRTMLSWWTTRASESASDRARSQS